MKKFTCEYRTVVKDENGKETDFRRKILALDYQSAYEEFLRQTVVADSEVLVTAGLGIMADTQTFDDHRKGTLESIRRAP